MFLTFCAAADVTPNALNKIAVDKATVKDREITGWDERAFEASGFMVLSFQFSMRKNALRRMRQVSELRWRNLGCAALRMIIARARDNDSGIPRVLKFNVCPRR